MKKRTLTQDSLKSYKSNLKQRLRMILEHATREKDYASKSGTLKGGIEAILSELGE